MPLDGLKKTMNWAAVVCLVSVLPTAGKACIGVPLRQLG